MSGFDWDGEERVSSGATRSFCRRGDISKARELAERRGMEVASYLSLLVHEALEREAKVAD